MSDWPQLVVPPWDYDIQTFSRWYAEAWNRWEGGKVPSSDPRSFEGFVNFARANGKDTTDLSLLGAPAWLPAPVPSLTPHPPDPTFPPVALGRIMTRFGAVSEPANSAIQQAWPQNLWKDAAEVSYLESSWNPNAENNTVDTIGPCGTPYTLPDGRRAISELSQGLYQINVCAHGAGNWKDPLTGAQKGYSLYQASGWYPWTYSSRALGLI